MSIVTDIKQTKGKKARKSVYIDDNFACTLDEFTIFKSRLKVGQQITLQELEDLVSESEEAGAFEKAVDLISSTPKTRKQIFDNLKQKGYLVKVCNNVLDKLEGYHYIDDERYAKMFVETYKNKYGKKKLEFMLLQKGVKQSIIDECLIDVESQDDIVLRLASKYMQNKGREPKDFEKLSRFLASKGFLWDDISNAISFIKRGEE